MKTLVQKCTDYLEMIKFEHSIFALPFAYLGLILAERGSPSLYLFLWITAAMISFRSMAMGANRLLDWKIDLANPRTSSRALPSGKLTKTFVWTITLLFLISFLSCSYVLGPVCFRLSLIPVFLAWLYPFAKRFTWLSHWILGMILGIAPYGAWLASAGTYSWIPAFLTIGVTVWVAGFDIIYALQDLQFDRKQGLHSFPSHFGEAASLKMTISLHIVAWLSWCAAGAIAELGVLFYCGMIFIAAMLAREVWLIQRHGLQKIQEAFFLTNAIVSVSLFCIVIADLL